MLAIAAVAIWFSIYDDKSPNTTGAVSEAPTESYSSIAVLAFADLSPDRDQEYFSDGISEELLNVLARQTDLRVAARTSSFSFKGKHEKIETIGAALNVDAVLEGSVRKAGDTVRVTAQLIDARTGFHLWSNTYDRKFVDVFEIQDEIAGSIVAALPSQDGGSLASKTTYTDSEAYDLFLQGRHHLSLRTRASIERALNLFNRAVEIDPDYAPAWAAIGMSANLLTRGPDTYGELTLAEANAIAAPAIERSLSLNPDLAEARAANGLLLAHHGKLDEAIEEYQAAIELNPSTPNARHLLYLTLTFAGRFEEAFDVIDEAAKFDPLSGIILENQVSSLVSRGRFEEAFSVARRLVAVNPGWPLALSALAAPYSETGKFAEAAKLAEVSAELSQSVNAQENAAFNLINIKLTEHPLVRSATMNPASFLAVTEGRFDHARELVMSQYASHPGDLFAAWRAGWTLWAIGDPKSAHELFERSLQGSDGADPIEPTSPFSCYPGLYIAGLRLQFGDVDNAVPILETCRQIIENMQMQGYEIPFFERDMPIELLMLEGRHEEALAALRELADSGRFISWWIEFEPIYSPVRDDPRFQQIVADLKSFAIAEGNRFAELQEIPR